MNSHQSIPDKTLALSLKLLGDWQQTQNFDLSLAEQRKLDNSQITDMAATLCRNYFRNLHYINWLIKKRADKSPRGRIKKVIGLALTQILDNDLQKEIICDTAVRFCKNKYSKFDASFVNQFLRSFTENDLPRPPDDIKLGLSPELLNHWKKHFSKEEIIEFSEVLKTPAVMTARLSPENPDISDLSDCLEKLKLPEWAGNISMYEVNNAKKFIRLNNGRLYIQDPAPLMAINLLAPKSGESIGDLCSAPGGKSLLIAQLLKGQGQLFSTDLSKKRLKNVEENLSAYKNVSIKQMDARQPELPPESLDGILLDIPCSNTGVIRRKTDVRWTFNQKKLKELSTLQLEILTGASMLLKKDGRLIYSTCSICPEENLNVVEKFIKSHPNFKIISHKTIFPSILHDGSFSCKIVK